MEQLANFDTDEEISFSVLLDATEDLIERTRKYEKEHPEDSEKARAVYGILSDALIEALDLDIEAASAFDCDEILALATDATGG